MPFQLQSKFVGRFDADQSVSFDDSDQDEENVIFCSSTLNLPKQSFKSAEYLGLRSGYPVYRKKSQECDKNLKSPKVYKRKYNCPIFESESPVQLFSSLPHPDELFGKRSKKKGKKKPIQVNPVQYHSWQLHQKQVKLNLTVDNHGESTVEPSYQGHSLSRTNTSVMLQLNSSAQHTSTTDDRNNSKESASNSNYDHANMNMESYYKNIKSPIHYPFHFKTISKTLEE